MLSLLLIFVWVALATYADTCFKACERLTGWRFLIGTSCYASCAFLAVATFRRQQWGWIVIVWNCVSLAVSMFLSVALYREPFTFRRIVASLLVLAAIFLAE